MKIIIRLLPVLFLFLAITRPAVSGETTAVPTQDMCRLYSDSFDTFRVDRWKDVLLYSESRGSAFVDEGRLVLESPKDDPCEIQVYSLFVFEGDFDLQVDYHLNVPGGLEGCRINTGLVLQTPADEMNYKFYLSSAPGKGMFFRTRLDRHGEINLETYKGKSAEAAGSMRIVRRNGRIQALAGGNGDWREIYTFPEPEEAPLRIRLKLQTSPASDETTGVLACPATVSFDNFAVNGCTRIIER